MWRSLGKVVVPVAGVPIRITQNQADPLARSPCQSMLFQQIAGNTGKVYIGDGTLDKATYVGVLAVLAVPTTNSLPSASATQPNAPAGLAAGDYFVDADVSGEGCLVSIIRT